MVSKGVDYYAYTAPTTPSPFQVSFSQPTNWGKSIQTYPITAVNTMVHGNLQISESDIHVTDHYGTFAWQAMYSNILVGSHSADIAPFTGNLRQGSDMGNMLQTPSVIGNGYNLSYGFYDAGSGLSGLTNQDQAYVYLTFNYSSWMGYLTSVMGDTLTSQPFGVFALPGAHDTGMFDPTCLESILDDAAFLGALAGLLGIAISELSKPAILRAAINLAFTQKDTITTMLNLGVRYFDFRPGTCYTGIEASGIYHQHLFVPGYPYSSFLTDVLTWLAAHPSEIVVVGANFQGFLSAGMEPDVATLTGMVEQAQKQTGTTNTILPGDKSDLSSSYHDLIQNNKRLIFLNQINASDDAQKYDSYGPNESLYKTVDPQNIITALNTMNSTGQQGYDYTVLQLQGTATGLPGAVLASIATMSDCSSPLLSTKAAFDNVTYPWLMTNVTNNLSPSQLVVFLNDFCDNALVAQSMMITRGRAENLAAQQSNPALRQEERIPVHA